MKRLFAWQPTYPVRMLMILAVLVYLIPAMWKLGVSDSMYHMEQMSLLPSQETWLRMEAGEPEAWRSPSMRGEPRIRKPPMLIWLNLVAWTGLDVETALPSDMTLRARWIALALGLAGVLATAWIGAQLFNPITGARASLVLASIFTVLKQARMATFDTHLLGWITLAVAASFAFARKWMSPWHALWFVVAALSAGCAFLTKGAVGLVYVVPPLLAVGCLTPSTRIQPLRLGLPVLLGLCGYGLWLWGVLENVPGAKEILAGETLQAREDPQPVLYYLIVIGLVFPWTILWLGLMPRMRNLNWRQAVPWLVFLAGLLILSIPDNRRQRYVIPLLPWFSLGFAQLWSGRGGSKGFTIAARIHVGLLSFLSVVLPFALPFQKQMVELGWFKDLELPGAGWIAAVLLAGFTWPLCVAMWMSVCAYRTRFLLPLTAVWLAGLYSFSMHFYVESYHGQYEHLAETTRLREAVGQNPAFLTAPDGAEWTAPDDRFLYHTARFFQPLEMTFDFPKGSRVLVPAAYANEAPESWSFIDTFAGRRRYSLFQVEKSNRKPE
jgi:4-amino-4-deoxy-L-arabinose transferase-like glycosyltransferase